MRLIIRLSVCIGLLISAVVARNHSAVGAVTDTEDREDIFLAQTMALCLIDFSCWIPSVVLGLSLYSLPPASSVEVIESDPCVCVCVSALSRPNHLTYDLDYRPQNRGDNAFGSVRVFVCVCVCMSQLSCLNRLTYDLHFWYVG